MVASAPEPRLISVTALRFAVGCIGLGLPWVLLVFGWVCFSEPVQASISTYYYTGMRDVFVGALCAIGLFLFAYQGYDWRDVGLGHLGALAVLGVAWFPTAPQDGATPHQELIAKVHYGSAAVFFAVLILFSLWLFRLTRGGGPARGAKARRNRIYLLCGLTMLFAIIAIGLLKLSPAAWTAWLIPWQPVFVLETVALTAFGISWFTKGAGGAGEQDEPTPVVTSGAGDG